MAIQSEDDVEANESVPLVPSPKNDNAAVSKRSAGSTTDRSGNDGRDKKVKKRLRKKKREATDSPLIKYGSLVLLVAQLVGLVMLMRYSRTHTNGKDLYLSSTAVFLYGSDEIHCVQFCRVPAGKCVTQNMGTRYIHTYLDGTL